MSDAARLAHYYAAAFLLVGVQLPFWPLWLAARGLDPGEIALLLAVALWLKALTNPLAGFIADRSGRRRHMMIALAATSLGGFLLFLIADGFWPLLLVNALTGIAASAVLPLADNLALAIAYAKGLDYGRMRLWGSASFIAASLGTGAILAGHPVTVLILLLILAAMLQLGATLRLPTHEAGAAQRLGAAWRVLLLDRRQLLFLAAATAIQASHSVYYAFGTIHWTRLGYDGATIGFLWSEGVVAEILLFAVGAKLVAKLGPARLLFFAGLAGTFRWIGTAMATELPTLCALQLLHAMSFGAAHLAAMHYLARALPPEWSASGQSLYSAIVSGIGFGLVMAGSGPLFAAISAASYLVMAALALAGALAALLLARTWHGGRLAVSG